MPGTIVKRGDSVTLRTADEDFDLWQGGAADP